MSRAASKDDGHRDDAAGAPARRGACPTLHAPMQTGDGLLLRVGLAGRAVTPLQLAALAAAARRFGNGIVEITARGNLQVRGFDQESARRFAETIEAQGIRPRDGLAVGLSPLAGLDAAERADPRPLAAAIEAGIERLHLSDRLAPKLSILVDGGDRIGLEGLKADICLRARDGQAWSLRVGNDHLGDTAGEKAGDAVLKVLTTMAARGRETRGTDLLRADLSGFADGATDAPASRSAAFDPVGAFSFGTDKQAVGLMAAFGQSSADAIAAIARQPVREFRPCPGGILLAIAPQNADALLAEAKANGFIVASNDPRRFMSACAGMTGCASGHISARALAAALAELPHLPRDIHVAGCDKGCARHGRAMVTIIGTPDGADVVLDGTTRDRPAFRTPSRDPAALAVLVRNALAA